MKTKIILSTILIIVIASLSTALVYSVKENKRISNNYDILIEQRLDEEQILTKKEFKKYFQEYADTLKSYGIKTKNVEHVINVSYRYKDSTILRDTLIYYFDTLKHVLCGDFSINDDCWLIDGKICEDSTIEVHNREFKDSILTALYKEKRCFKKAKYKAVSISKCKGDTLQVTDNIKIIKNKIKRKTMR